MGKEKDLTAGFGVPAPSTGGTWEPFLRLPLKGARLWSHCWVRTCLCAYVHIYLKLKLPGRLGY